MPTVGFDTVSDELEDAERLVVMHALVRTSIAHGADNRPAMVILTEKAVFYGGSEAFGGKFTRVPLNGIIDSGRAGTLIWECVRLRHMELEGEKTVYICPFRGHPSAPIKDDESMAELIRHLSGV